MTLLVIFNPQDGYEIKRLEYCTPAQVETKAWEGTDLDAAQSYCQQLNDKFRSQMEIRRKNKGRHPKWQS